MAELPIVLTQNQQATTIQKYLPGGRAHAAAQVRGTNIRKLLLGFATELMRVDSLISLFRIDTNPKETQFFLDEWENALGIPDICFSGLGTNDDRRVAILIKLSALGIQTNADFVDLAARLGIEVTITAGSVHGLFPWVWPKFFYETAKEARFTIFITPLQVIGESFTYTFPITFGDENLAILECLFAEFKPANVQVIFNSI